MEKPPLNPILTRQLMEVRKCRRSVAYFLDTYAQVFDATVGGWLPFRLWPAQYESLGVIEQNRLVVILKARQLGFSWLTLGFALHQMILNPSATVLLFSKRDDEAVELLDMRLKAMHARLPAWLQAAEGKSDGKHDWALANGSRAKAFPTTGGRSYTASLIIVDEADFVPDLNALLNAAKPAIDAGGRLVLLSSSDKSAPESTFKRIYRSAKAGDSPYRPVFYDWRARPDRTEDWYAEQAREFFARTGSHDYLYQEYPNTDLEALAPNALDKRIPSAWLTQCYREQRPYTVPGSPSIPGMVIFLANPPVPGRRFVIGADPAEGNPTSDDSALSVLDADNGEEVAALAGKFDPSVFAGHVAAVSAYFNGAPALVERNNHGHAVLLWLRDNSKVHLLSDHDGKPGWNTTSKSKAQLWTTAADAFRDRTTILHSFGTFTQLSSIEGATLRAPDGQHDDRAVAYGLGLQAIGKAASGVVKVVTITGGGEAKKAPAPDEIFWPSEGEDRW